MLIPRYSILSIFLITAVCAVLSAVFSLALNGHEWAWAITFVAIMLVLLFAIHAGMFTLAIAIGKITGRAKQDKSSPFESHASRAVLAPPKESSGPT